MSDRDEQSRYEVRTLHRLDEMRALLQVANGVWGPPAGSMVSPDYLMALAHTGGYVAGLFTRDTEPTMVGCSFGMLGRFRTRLVLHSHITGILTPVQNRGLGRMFKQHQRAWATSQGLEAVTWTFDPLVRRNGWFNLHCLGATAEEYHIDFYGPLRDSINGDDESDRLLAHWETSSPRVDSAAGGALPALEPHPDDVLVATPDDIVALRGSDPGEARKWRTSVREQLMSAFDSSHIVGMTRQGEYVVRRRDRGDANR